MNEPPGQKESPQDVRASKRAQSDSGESGTGQKKAFHLAAVKRGDVDDVLDVGGGARTCCVGHVESRVAAASAAAPGLPCLNSNNSNELLSSGHRRTAFALSENVRLLAEKFTLERLGFLTLTFRDHVTDIKEAQKRFNSLRTGVLAERYAASIAVVERMKSGRIHFHLLVVCPEDIRTGFRFEDIEKGDYTSANAWLRAEWAFWRKTAPNYGFGRTELLPVKSTAEGIAKYVGKYIAKHIDQRRQDDKGARLVRYTVSARQVGTSFAWVSPRATLWRLKVAQFAKGFGVSDLRGMKPTFGPKWAYKLGDVIAAEVLPSYPTALHASIDGMDTTGIPPGATNISFERGWERAESDVSDKRSDCHVINVENVENVDDVDDVEPRGGSAAMQRVAGRRVGVSVPG